MDIRLNFVKRPLREKRNQEKTMGASEKSGTRNLELARLELEQEREI